MFFALFLNLSFTSLRFSQINRCFMSIYKGLLEASLITINSRGEPTFPYFDKTRINNYIVNYLDNNLSKYSTDYEIKTKYLNRDSSTICLSNCKEVKISIKAKINYLFTYEKAQSFVVRSAEEL